MALHNLHNRRAKNIALGVLALGLFFTLLFLTGREVVQGMTLARRSDLQEEEIDALSARAFELARALESSQTSLELEEAARSLGLGKPGETSVHIPTRETFSAENILGSTQPKNPRLSWWHYFTENE